MNNTQQRTDITFKLRSELIERLKASAAKANRSLNNYVESVLLDIEFSTPNEETKAAIAEARSGKSAGTLDISSYENFIRSIN